MNYYSVPGFFDSMLNALQEVEGLERIVNVVKEIQKKPRSLNPNLQHYVKACIFIEIVKRLHAEGGDIGVFIRTVFYHKNNTLGGRYNVCIPLPSDDYVKILSILDRV